MVRAGKKKKKKEAQCISQKITNYINITFNSDNDLTIKFNGVQEKMNENLKLCV